MAQQRLRVPEPQGLGHKRTGSEDNLYLAVLRASEGKKGSRHSSREGSGEAGRAHFLWQEAWLRWGWGPDLGCLDLGDRLCTGLGLGAGTHVLAQVQSFLGPITHGQRGGGWVHVGPCVGGSLCPGKDLLLCWRTRIPPGHPPEASWVLA